MGRAPGIIVNIIYAIFWVSWELWDYFDVLKLGVVTYFRILNIVNQRNNIMNTVCEFNLFVRFTLQYPIGFVRQAFSGLPIHTINHLGTKFMTCYNDRGSYGAMIACWSELSEQNRNILTDYITKSKL